MAAYYEKAPESVLALAQEIVDAHHETRNLGEARICFVMREEAPVSQGKTTAGKASKFPEKLRPHLDFDFLIWLAKDVWEAYDEDRRRALLDHELCHCDYSEGTPKLRHHDVEEFIEIVERYGYWRMDLVALRDAGERSQLRLPEFMPARGGVGTIPGEKIEAAIDGLNGDTDPLIVKALDVAKKKGWGPEQISPAHLQRALRIGFPRAARLKDELLEIMAKEAE